MMHIRAPEADGNGKCRHQAESAWAYSDPPYNVRQERMGIWHHGEGLGMYAGSMNTTWMRP